MDRIADERAEAPDYATREAEGQSRAAQWLAGLSETDRTILEHIQDGHFTGVRELAKELHMSSKTLEKRVAQLKAKAKAILNERVKDTDGVEYQDAVGPENRDKKITDELFQLRDNARGIRLENGYSEAAIRQSLEDDVASLPENVKTGLLKIFDARLAGSFAPGAVFRPGRFVSGGGIVGKKSRAAVAKRRKGATLYIQ